MIFIPIFCKSAAEKTVTKNNMEKTRDILEVRLSEENDTFHSQHSFK